MRLDARGDLAEAVDSRPPPPPCQPQVTDGRGGRGEGMTRFGKMCIERTLMFGKKRGLRL